MGINKHRQLKKMLKGNGGELLIETVIAFAVFLILLVAGAFIIVSGAHMNQEAHREMDERNAAVSLVEQDAGEDLGTGTFTITIGSTKCQETVSVKGAGKLVYFKTE